MTNFIWKYRSSERVTSRLRARSSCGSKLDERGQAAVLVAIAIVAILGFLALVTDVGQFYLVRNRIQAAADSAALAGAQDLAQKKSQTVAAATAHVYADRNVTTAHQTTVTFNGSDIVVRLSADQATFFGRVLGRATVAIAASATAGGAPVTGVRDLVPIAIPFSSIAAHTGSDHPAAFNFGQEGSDPSQGGIFWLVNLSNDSGVGESTYGEWIENGYPAVVSVGNIMAGTGIMAGLKAELQDRIDERPHVIVPLYDFAEASGGNKNYHVVGFAEFVITAVDFSGSDKTVSGYFTTGTLVDGETGGTPPLDYGIQAVRLKG
ncbi:MAG: pilus assembly protein TadG-related protein [Actinomycetota bacterium]|nr:pilus assembly protein TadG-related protein [Actinomycetota bacterium]